MIVEVAKEYARQALTPLVRALKAQEAQREDVVLEDVMLQQLEDGQQKALLFLGGLSPVPMMVLFVSEGAHPLSGRGILYVNYILVSSSEDLYQNFDPQDATAFGSLIQHYDCCLFVSSNPAIPVLVEKLGLLAKPIQTVYQISAKEG